ncbi:MAG UNVERIFIED_CONTAM: hypothetical protein LVR18_19565 [Planctomycetaceae bacterium]|jgi:predicted Rossmann-fold nucleotide-binding protein
MLNVCVFCGARGGDTDGYGSAAAELATYLAAAGHRLIYGVAVPGSWGVWLTECWRAVEM